MLLLTSIEAQHYTTIPLTGNDISTAMELDFKDPICSTFDLCSPAMNICSYESYVELGIGPLTDETVTYATGIYKLIVEIEVDYVEDPDVLVPNEMHSLEIELNAEGGVFKNIDRIYINGGIDINVVITSVSFTDPAGVVVNDIPVEAYLTIGADVERFENLNTALKPSINFPSAGADPSFALSWDAIDGAEFYELEWSWYDTERVFTNTTTYDKYDDFNFKYNSTRVRISDNSYEIANLYRVGAIIARVRTVGRNSDCEEYVFGDWSIGDEQDFDDLTAGTDYFLVDGHLEGFNWDSEKSLAEEGKMNDLISYFDGGLKERQNVSRIESKNLAIVSESYYDHIGRAVIQTLQTPVIENNEYRKEISFYDQLNKVNSIPFNNEHFESSTDCDLSPAPMDEKGNSLYYSSSNPILDNHQGYLPKANGFPYAQVVYTQDKTEKISRQSGIGESFRIGSGNETKYYYGKPEQYELDRLFGNDVGYAEYYEKHMMVDPNGQVSVSYIDNNDRLIASALSGSSPDQLIELPNINDWTNIFDVVSDVLTYDEVKLNGTNQAHYSANKGFLVSSDNTDFTYDYTFLPQDFEDPTCAPNVCFDCAYNLDITLYNECNQIVIESDENNHNEIGPSIVDENCEDNGTHSFQLSTTLDVGSYNINRELSLDQEVMQLYEEIYVDNYECAKTEVEVFDSLIVSAIENFEGCIDQQCLSTCMATLNVNDYLSDLEGYVDALSNCIDEKIEGGECVQTTLESVSACESLRQMIEADMRPHGQYGAVVDSVNYSYDRSLLPCTSIYAKENIFDNTTYESILAGQTIEINGGSHLVEDLSLRDLAENFDDDLLALLIPYHPEFVFLEYCENVNNASITYDENLLIYNQEDARVNGYMNPFGQTGFGYNNIGGNTGVIVSGAIAEGDAAEVQASINAFKLDMLKFPIHSGNPNDYPAYSIWDYAYMGAIASLIDLEAMRMANALPAPGQWDEAYGNALCSSEKYWEVFRGLYMGLKQKHSESIIEEYVKDYFISNQSFDYAEDIINSDCYGEDYGTSCEGCDTWNKVEQRYYRYSDLMDDNGDPIDEMAGGPGLNDALDNPDEDAMLANMEAYCTETCEGYRDMWRRELQTCVSSTTLTDVELELLLDDLVEVCEFGCDAENPLGSNENPKFPEEGQFADFKEVFDTHLTTSKDCDELLLSAPGPYGKSLFAGQDNYIDDCVCEKYDQIFEDYSVGISNPNLNDFIIYLQDNYGTSFELDQIADLDCACRQIDSEFLLEKAVSRYAIEAPFDCTACVDCDQVLELFEEYIDSDDNHWGGISTNILVKDEQQKAMTNWLNHRLGFNLSFTEYWDFLIHCGVNINHSGSRPANSGWTLIGDGKLYNRFVPIEEKQITKKKEKSNRRSGASGENPNLTFSLKKLVSEAEKCEIIKYEYTIVNNGSATANFSFYDALPPGFEFVSTPSNLFGGTVNATPNNILSIDGIDLNAGESITWVIDVEVNCNIFQPGFYCHQAELLEYSYTTYSDDPETIDPSDETCIFVNFDDPCAGPKENEEDMLTLFNELINVMGPSCNYPYIIPFSTLSSLGLGSSLNLWPYYDLANLELEILDPALNNGELVINLINACAVSEILCSVFIKGYELCDIQEFISISPSIYLDENGNFMMIAVVILTTGEEVSITICSGCYDLFPCDKELLCNRSIFFAGVLEDDCTDYLFDLYALEARTQVENEINNAREKFRLEYPEQCMDEQDELIQTFTNREYHHTLYYYDQSDNLVRTVAPKGVQYLTNTTQVENHRANPAYNPAYPANTFVTNYQQNNFNQTINADIPDAEEELYYHDDLGRLIIFQDGRQRTFSKPRFTYVIHDEQGRVIETGEVATLEAVSNDFSGDFQAFTNWVYASNNDHFDVSISYYDENLFDQITGIDVDTYFDSPRKYLRQRLSSSLYYNDFEPGDLDYDHGMHYDYDAHGNVTTLINEYSSLKSINQHLKRIDYNYDIVSGKVHKVSYQSGQNDEYYHKYLYDEDNKLIEVFTSEDGNIWDSDASYEYYDHGKISRTELGNYKVQACDIAYTLQGWLKGINSGTLIESRDIGKDGLVNGVNAKVAPDAFGYHLGYYANDPTNPNFTSSDYDAIDPSLNSVNHFLPTEPDGLPNLYNGNIRSSLFSMIRPDGTMMANTPNVYTYDQLQRIKEMQRHASVDQTTNSWSNSPEIFDYNTNMNYDANGNLTSLYRRTENGQFIDALNYTYENYWTNNRLDRVTDGVALTAYDNDVDNQIVDNYGYDGAGNLIRDEQEGINNIEWNRQGKIVSIFRSATPTMSNPNIYYEYDADGNRIVKKIQKGSGPSDWEYRFYIRDVKGNILKIYSATDTSIPNSSSLEFLFENESHLYGIGRLGVNSTSIPGVDLSTYVQDDDKFIRKSGLRNYELSNHQGNVMSVISDNKLLSLSGNALPKYKADVMSVTDYYPFGWEMLGRTESNDSYRFGFNGKEKDDEVKGSGAQYDYGFRIYDSRIGKFLSVDPLSSSYPWYTPYQFAGNSPIAFNDLDGLEEYHYMLTWDENGENPVLSLESIEYNDWGDYVFPRSLYINDYYIGDKIFSEDAIHELAQAYSKFTQVQFESMKMARAIADAERKQADEDYHAYITDIAYMKGGARMGKAKAKTGKAKSKSGKVSFKSTPAYKKMLEGIRFGNSFFKRMQLQFGNKVVKRVRLVPQNSKGNMVDGKINNNVKGNRTDTDTLKLNDDGKTFTIYEAKLTTKSGKSTGQRRSQKHVESGNQKFEVRTPFELDGVKFNKGDIITVTKYQIEYKFQ